MESLKSKKIDTGMVHNWYIVPSGIEGLQLLETIFITPKYLGVYWQLVAANQTLLPLGYDRTPFSKKHSLYDNKLSLLNE